MESLLLIDNTPRAAASSKTFARRYPTDDRLIANGSAYGLAASVFSRDVTGAVEVARQLQRGSSHVNGATVQNETQAPFGGTKGSGYSRFDGRAGIDKFIELK